MQYRTASGKVRKLYGRMNHFHTKRERLSEFERIINKLQNPELVQVKQSEGLIANLEAVLDYKRPQLAEKSYQSYFSYLHKFAAWYNQQPRKTDPADYIRFMYSKGFHPNYILRNKICLASWFKVLVKKNQYPANPFADIKIKKIKAQSLLAFHPDQVSVLKKEILATDPQLWDACLFEYYLFFRPKEIRMLKVENILFEAQTVSVGHTITKDDDVLLKAIPMPLQPVINKFRGLPPNWYLFSSCGKPGPVMLSRDHLSKRHRVILERLNYSHRYAFYSWVHTGAKNAAMAGIPLKQLQLQKGHSDLRMFDEYLKKIGVNECTQMIEQFPAI